MSPLFSSSLPSSAGVSPEPMAAQGPKMPVHRLTNIVFGGVVAGVLIVLGFYLIAD
jgi:hypothetical protein